MHSNRVASRLLGLAVGLGMILAQAPLTARAAATDTWTGAGTDQNWSNPANWAGHLVPAAGDDLVFPATSALYPAANNDLPANTEFHSISTGTSSYSLSGNAFALTAGFTGGAWFSGPVNLTADQTITCANQCRFDHLDSGTTNLLISGAGRTDALLVGSGTIASDAAALGVFPGSTFSGSLAVSAGTLDLQFPQLTAAALTVGLNATVTGGGTVGSLANGTDGGGKLSSVSLQVGTNNQSTSFDGSFDYYLAKLGTGTLSLGGVANGDVEVKGGTVRVASSSVYPNRSNAPRIFVHQGATFDMNGFSATVGALSDSYLAASASGGQFVLGSGTLTVNGTAGSFSGVISGVGGFTVSGSGFPSETLSGANTYTGPTTVSNGILRIQGDQSQSQVSVGSNGQFAGGGRLGTLDVSGGLGLDYMHLRAGDVLFAPGSTVSAGLGPLVNAPELLSTGHVDLSGAPTLSIYPFSNLPPSHTGDVITVVSANSVSGQFSNVADGALLGPARAQWRINYTPTAVTATYIGQPEWSGNGATANWSDTGNWRAHVVPQDGDDVTFPAGVANRVSHNDLAGLSLRTLTISDAGYAMDGLSVGIGGGTLNSTTSSLFLDLPITVGAGQTMAMNLAGSLVMGALEGTGTVTVTGPHSFLPSFRVQGSASTFSGRFVLAAGDLFYSGTSSRPNVVMQGNLFQGVGAVGAVTAPPTASPNAWNRIRVADAQFHPGTLQVSSLQLKHGDYIEPSLEGVTPGTGYGQIVVDSGGDAVIDGTFFDFLSCSPTAPGDRIALIHHLGPGATTGTFAGLPEGSQFDMCGGAFAITYKGGANHNDVVFRRVAPSVAVVGSDGQAWSRQGGGWVAQGQSLLGAPAVMRTAPEMAQYPSLELYGVGTDGNIWVKASPGTWQPLVTGQHPNCIDSPAVALKPPTDMYSNQFSGTIACEGADHALWVAQFNPTNNQGKVTQIPGTAFSDFGGSLMAGPAVDYVGGAATPTYFVVGVDRHIWTATRPGQWTQMSWQCIGHPAVSTVGTTTYFACHGIDNALWVDTYTNGHWQGARSLGGIVVDGVGAVADRLGATFFVEGIDHAVYETRLTNGVQGPWSSDGGYVNHGVGASY